MRKFLGHRWCPPLLAAAFLLLPLIALQAQEPKAETPPAEAAPAEAAPAETPPAEAAPSEPATPSAESTPPTEGSTPPAEEEAAAAPSGPTTADLKVMADTVWVMITGMLVFFMNLGFACVESGMCRAKNCVNILSKNFIVFAVTTIGFWLLGWGLMFGNGSTPYHRQRRAC